MCTRAYVRSQIGIPEDLATGGARGPLAAYMMRYGLLPANAPAAFISEQRTKLGRPSFLHVRTHPAKGAIQVEQGRLRAFSSHSRA
jgi:predicted PhzF superfamily epimerase YddE/YHI9